LPERAQHQIPARLEHANIARLIDGGAEGGSPYFVMKYAEGVPISEFASVPGNSRESWVMVFLKAGKGVQ
jgi:serine/threonine-protein kinase